MNNDAGKMVREVLESLGHINRAFRDTATKLERLPQVENTVTALEVMSYENGPSIEGYIDAELKGGSGISWRFDVRWDADSWNIRGTLERNTASGNEVVQRVPPENVTQIVQLPEALTRMAQRLLELRSEEL